MLASARDNSQIPIRIFFYSPCYLRSNLICLAIESNYEVESEAIKEKVEVTSE